MVQVSFFLPWTANHLDNEGETGDGSHVSGRRGIFHHSETTASKEIWLGQNGQYPIPVQPGNFLTQLIWSPHIGTTFQ